MPGRRATVPEDARAPHRPPAHVIGVMAVIVLVLGCVLATLAIAALLGDRLGAPSRWPEGLKAALAPLGSTGADFLAALIAVLFAIAVPLVGTRHRGGDALQGGLNDVLLGTLLITGAVFAATGALAVVAAASGAIAVLTAAQLVIVSFAGFALSCTAAVYAPPEPIPSQMEAVGTAIVRLRAIRARLPAAGVGAGTAIGVGAVGVAMLVVAAAATAIEPDRTALVSALAIIGAAAVVAGAATACARVLLVAEPGLGTDRVYAVLLLLLPTVIAVGSVRIAVASTVLLGALTALPAAVAVLVTALPRRPGRRPSPARGLDAVARRLVDRRLRRAQDALDALQVRQRRSQHRQARRRRGERIRPR